MNESSPFAGTELDALPAWARDALAASLRPADVSAPTAAAQRGAPEWPLLVDAALAGAFLPRELAPDTLRGSPARHEAERAVLEFAETTQTPGGLRWSLTRDARTAVIRAALGGGELAAAVERTRKAFRDPISKALRDCVGGPSGQGGLPGDLDAAEATRVAVAWLSGIEELSLPPLEELDRQIELRRLHSDFERMVGRVRGAGDSPPDDRFFGRTEEMELLRDYVGVIAAESFRHMARRAARGLVRRLRGRAPMAVWGVGGVGKTTLVAKFMLDHAHAATSRFPFAYLDFDRSTVSARNPATLLVEMCTQVGAQLPEITEPLARLREKVRRDSRFAEAAAESEPLSLLQPRIAEFRQIVDEYLDGMEKLLDRARPFLLVFDTFEVVQYSPDDVDRLEEFVLAFSHGKADDPWPRLRLVIAGRRQVEHFIQEVEPLELGALDRAGSVEMLVTLAADAGKPITPRDAGRLVAAITRGLGSRESGVHPLRLRLVGEVFKEKGEGAAIVDSLRAELAAPASDEGIVGRLLVDGILVRRILGHVADARVRALADPGLVVRRITPGVIRELMARGTARPVPGAAEHAPERGKRESADARRAREDPEHVEPWEIGETEAAEIFDAFRAEVSLVYADGDALRHRQDVRQEMLPLIRARRPRRFAALHRLAYDFFLARVHTDPGDAASAGEAIYHGLWAGVPLEELDGLWRTGPGFDPRIDAEEFDQRSPAHVYVRARLGGRLSPRDLRVLPRGVALAWLASGSGRLLVDFRVDEALSAVQAVGGADYAGLDPHVEVAAVAARLLFRAGLWADATRLIRRHLDPVPTHELARAAEAVTATAWTRPDPRQAALVSLVRTWATIAAKAGAGPAEMEVIREIAERLRDPVLHVEALAHVELSARRTPGSVRDERGAIGGVARRVPADRWLRDARILRLATLTAGGDVRELLAAYVGLGRPLPRESRLRGDVARIFEAVGDRHPLGERDGGVLDAALGEKADAESFAALDELWRRRKADVVQVVRERTDLTASFWLLVAHDHGDWLHVLGNALSRALRAHGRQVAAVLDEVGVFQNREAQRWAEQKNGLRIVRGVADEGRLLEFAEAFRKLRLLPTEKGPPSPDSQAEAPRYPQDVSGIAEALVAWHRTIMVEIGPPRPTGLASGSDAVAQRGA